MDSLLFSSAIELAAAIRTGDITSQEVTQAYLERLAGINPHLNGLTVLAPDALEQAAAADRALAQGKVLSPLHGVPFTVKDVFAVAGLESRLDQQVRRRAAPDRDAIPVERLRQAGAVLLGRTNCPPSGGGVDTENAFYGRTLNPYNLAHTPGGSSGGEAALIAAGGSPMGLGSDTSGGVRIPAHYCGVAALRPTQGRIPNTGVYNQPGGLTDQRTQIGPLARRVADLYPLLQLLAGPDYADSGVVPMPLYDPATVQVSGLILANLVPDPDAQVEPAVVAAQAAAAQSLTGAGVQVEATGLADLVAEGRQVDRAWRNMAGSTGRDVVEIYNGWDYYRSRLLHFLIHYDALLCPVDRHPAPVYGDRDLHRFDYTNPFSLVGLPCVVVRAGSDPQGLPIGVQIVAHPWREEIALALALVVEKALGGWQPSPL